jgi:hypothetical protein
MKNKQLNGKGYFGTLKTSIISSTLMSQEESIWGEA